MEAEIWPYSTSLGAINEKIIGQFEIFIWNFRKYLNISSVVIWLKELELLYFIKARRVIDWSNSDIFCSKCCCFYRDLFYLIQFAVKIKQSIWNPWALKTHFVTPHLALAQIFLLLISLMSFFIERFLDSLLHHLNKFVWTLIKFDGISIFLLFVS